MYFGGSLRLDISRELLCLSLVSPPLRRVGEAIRRPSTASSTLSTDPTRREASTARSTADREREAWRSKRRNRMRRKRRMKRKTRMIKIHEEWGGVRVGMGRKRGEVSIYVVNRYLSNAKLILYI